MGTNFDFDVDFDAVIRAFHRVPTASMELAWKNKRIPGLEWWRIAGIVGSVAVVREGNEDRGGELWYVLGMLKMGPERKMNLGDDDGEFVSWRDGEMAIEGKSELVFWPAHLALMLGRRVSAVLTFQVVPSRD